MTLFGPRIDTRLAGLLGMLAAAVFGLATRTEALRDWPIIGPYGGDAAWTMAACSGILMLLPHLPVGRVAMFGWLVSAAVECSQLIHVDWLDALRGHPLGALLLGRGFLWSDLAAYAGGAVTFAGIATLLRRARGAGGMLGSEEKEAESAGRNLPPSG